MATHGSHPPHGHVHLDEADWGALVGHAELEGELLLAFVTDTAEWIAELRGADAPPVRRVLDIGRPGLAERLDRAERDWFAVMRAGLSGSVPTTELASMLSSGGFDVVGSRLALERFAPPLSDTARRFAARHVGRARQAFHELLDDDDLRTLDVLSDPDDPRSVLRRGDVFVATSRQILVARPRRSP